MAVLGWAARDVVDCWSWHARRAAIDSELWPRVRHTRSAALEVKPIEILIELLLSGVFDVLLELLYQAFGTSRDAKGRFYPVSGGLGVLVFGGIAGGLTTWALPGRVFGAPVLPGASLLLSPILNGVLMHYVGVWRAQRLERPSFIATFWGGALFAFGFAAVRLAFVVE